jgi:hypothetical protein
MGTQGKRRDGRIAGFENVSCTGLNHYYRREVSDQTRKDQAFKSYEQLLPATGVPYITMTIPMRLRLLAGVFFLLFAFWLWHWIAAWGLVTVRAYDESFANIQRSIERQGRIKIVSNVPPETKISMAVTKVPAVEAVSVLAARVDGRWSVTYVVAPDKTGLAGALAAMQSPESNPAFRFFRVRGWGEDMFSSPPDVRRVRWNVSVMEENSLQSYLDQLVQKTGVTVAVATDWNPVIANAPDGGEAGRALRSMVSRAGGKVDEVFGIIIRPDDGSSGGDRADSNDLRPWGGGGNASGGNNRSRAAASGASAELLASQRGESNRAWAEERMMAQMELLPPAEKEVVQKEYDEARKFFAELRELPADQRRAAFEQRMNDPAVQERMMEREIARDTIRGPERRVARYKRYIERKQNYKNAHQN